MSDPISGFSNTVMADTLRLLCGEHLGEGQGRDVFVLRTDPTKVVKVENKSHSFQNQMEWLTWQELAFTPHAKWLAPCRHISSGGIALIMDRTAPLPPARRPERLPAWLTDFKDANYGLLKGKLVCHDYGTNLLLNHGAYLRRGLRPVKWPADA